MSGLSHSNSSLHAFVGLFTCHTLSLSFTHTQHTHTHTPPTHTKKQKYTHARTHARARAHTHTHKHTKSPTHPPTHPLAPRSPSASQTALPHELEAAAQGQQNELRNGQQERRHENARYQDPLDPQAQSRGGEQQQQQQWGGLLLPCHQTHREQPCRLAQYELRQHLYFCTWLTGSYAHVCESLSFSICTLVRVASAFVRLYLAHWELSSFLRGASASRRSWQASR